MHSGQNDGDCLNHSSNLVAGLIAPDWRSRLQASAPVARTSVKPDCQNQVARTGLPELGQKRTGKQSVNIRFIHLHDDQASRGVFSMRALLIAAQVLIASSTLMVAPAFAQSMELAIDEARPLRMSTPITGVVVGNAGIADVIVHDASMLFVLGKSVGTTTVVAVDSRGRTVYNGVIEVRAAENDGLVIVQRGRNGVDTLQCSDRCVTVVSPYGNQEGNAAAAANATTRSGFARGGGS
jgi:hypothetical protein